MKVFLTGATGFLGRYVLEDLVKAEIDVVVIGRHRPKGFNGQFIEVDLLAPVNVGDIIGEVKPTHLMHFAWYAEHGKYWSSTLNLRWVEASVRLAESFCAAGGQHIVGAGTCAEYDWSEGYCQENKTELAPSTLYGRTKDATRRLIEGICAEHGVIFSWGRIFLPYGLGEDESRLLPSLLQVFKGEKAPFGVNGSAYRDFLHAQDVAQAFLLLLLADKGGVYNISSGEPTRISDVVHWLAEKCDVDPNSVLDLHTERPGEPRMLVGDNAKINRLGFSPAISLKKYIDLDLFL